MTPTYADLCRMHGLAPDPAQTAIEVSKTARRLRLLQDGVCLAELQVIVGREPAGHKEREGDLRTPEGEYFVCYRNPGSRFHRFLGLSYPNQADADAGLAAGTISADQHGAIVAAIRAGQQPDWYTALGGEVGLHGGGIDRSGTRGCVAMTNDDIELLWQATTLSTRVRITP